MEFFT